MDPLGQIPIRQTEPTPKSKPAPANTAIRQTDPKKKAKGKFDDSDSQESSSDEDFRPPAGDRPVSPKKPIA